MVEFSTVDIDGEICLFQYSNETNELSDEVTFKVYSIPLNRLLWFSYRVKILDVTLAKSEQLTINGNTEFAKKGIPEKIIQIDSHELKTHIKSSSISFQQGDYLIPSACKAWKRLVIQSENAVLDLENNCFFYKRIL